MTTFEQLGLSKQALASLVEAGFTEPTEIQSKAIRLVAERKDLIGSAQTGSGKTVAYALPILDILRSEERTGKAKTKALVIVPTRELALQVRDEFERFGAKSGFRAVALFGGIGYRQQVQNLHRGADIIVATPGRLLDCLNRNFATLSKVQVVVLDEADRLLDMGFMPQVRAVIARTPEQRQTLMFSATIDSRMKNVADEFLRSPVVVAANQDKIEPSSIEQQFHYMKESQKEGKLLELLLTVEEGASVLVFTRTRRKAGSLAIRLRELEVLAEEIHGDISQSQRVRTLARFRTGEFNVLVATDVAARGLDVPAISHVINYDLPMQAEDYVHRIGRTGRAGRSGIAHSFVSNDQRRLVQEIHQILKNAGKDEPGKPSKPFQRPSREAVEYAERLSSGGRQQASAGKDRRFNQSDARRKPGNSSSGRSMGNRSMDTRSSGARSVGGRLVEGRSNQGRSVEGRPVEGRTNQGRSVDRRQIEGQINHKAASTEQTKPPVSKRLFEEEAELAIFSLNAKKPERKTEHRTRVESRSRFGKANTCGRAKKRFGSKAR